MRWPICNGRPDTALKLGRLSTPLCARCCGATVGTFIAVIGYDILPLGACPSVALALAGAVDGIRTYYCGGGTTNTVRLVAGILLGAGVFGVLLQSLSLMKHFSLHRFIYINHGWVLSFTGT